MIPYDIPHFVDNTFILDLVHEAVLLLDFVPVDQRKHFPISCILPAYCKIRLADAPFVFPIEPPAVSASTLCLAPPPLLCLCEPFITACQFPVLLQHFHFNITYLLFVKLLGSLVYVDDRHILVVFLLLYENHLSGVADLLLSECSIALIFMTS